MSMELLKEKCVEFRRLMGEKERLTEELAEVNKGLELLSRVQIPEIAEALDIKTVTFDGVGRLQFASDLFCSTKEGRTDEAMQWLRDCGYTDMIAETYNASSMKALMRQLIVAGTEVPDFMSITPFTRASLVRTKSKEA